MPIEPASDYGEPMDAPAPSGPGADDQATAYLAGRTSGTAGEVPGEGPGTFPAVPGYQVERVLGQGGMGVVYLARDLRLDRRVALKRVRFCDPVLAQRLLQEARAQAKVDHPHICKVYEAGVVGGTPYIAMQYLEGERLDRAAAQLSRDARVRLVATVADAMHAAHQLGLVHRDLKPGNILVSEGPDGTPWPFVMDFGLARDSDAVRETQAGDVLGTPAYMAPEQARGDVAAIDRRTDVYALGVTLYELLVGRLPFEGGSGAQTLVKVLQEEPTRPTAVDPDLPRDLEAILLACLEKAPARRYPSAKALAADLQAYLAGDPIQARRIGVLGRLVRKARRHRTVTALLALLVLSGALGLAALLRTRAQVAEAAALGQELGRQVTDAEAVLRFGHLMPPHPIAREEQKLLDLRRDLTAREPALKGPARAAARLALGEIELVAGRFRQAFDHFAQARRLGLRDPRLDVAQSEASLNLLEDALFEAATSKVGPELEQARQAAFATYLAPVEGWMQGRNVPRIRMAIALARHQTDAVVREREACLRAEPWRYETYQTLAISWRTRLMLAQGAGRFQEAAEALGQSWESLAAARELAPSDPSLAEIGYELANRALELRTPDILKVREIWQTRAEEALGRLEVLRPGEDKVRMIRAKQQLAAIMERQIREAVPEGAFEPVIGTFSDLAGHAGHLQLEGAFLAATARAVAVEERLNQGRDPEPLASGMIEVLKPALAVHPAHQDLLVRLGYAHAYRAWHQLRTGRDAGADLRAGWQAAANALASNPDHMEALMLRCLLGAMRARQAVRLGEDPAADLSEATRCRDQLVRQMGTDREVWLETAWLRLAEAEAARARKASPAEALRSAQTALAGLRTLRLRAGVAAWLGSEVARVGGA